MLFPSPLVLPFFPPLTVWTTFVPHLLRESLSVEMQVVLVVVEEYFCHDATSDDLLCLVQHAIPVDVEALDRVTKEFWWLRSSIHHRRGGGYACLGETFFNPSGE